MSGTISRIAASREDRDFRERYGKIVSNPCTCRRKWPLGQIADTWQPYRRNRIANRVERGHHSVAAKRIAGRFRCSKSSVGAIGNEGGILIVILVDNINMIVIVPIHNRRILYKIGT
jgi:hypothetical protein